jgi:uncharacterized membrane protein YraQ (UPF0718 family)
VTGHAKSPPGSIHLVILLLPVWLMLFYFRTTIAHWIVNTVFDMDQAGRFSGSLEFFIYTLIKIFLLLVLVIFILSLIRTLIPTEKIKLRLQSMPPLQANVFAGILGVLTPFCSCSAVPLFIGFLETGVPLGITFTFLIASPLVNEVILTMLAGLFGLKTALIYLAGGMVIAIVSGMTIDKLGLEKYLPGWMLEFRTEKPRPVLQFTLEDRFAEGIRSVKLIFKRTWLFVIMGVLLGSAIHGYVPEFLSGFPETEAWFSIPLAVVIGIPLYACSAAVAPVAFALVDKGLPLGTALAFIMAVAGLSLPEFIMLRKVLSARLIIVFIGIVSGGIILMGYLFNWIL